MAKDKVYTQEMGQPPKEPDGGSVGRKYVPEQLGSGIKVDKDLPSPPPTKPKKMAKGGTASSRADGCATKGKTKGTMIAMKSGGMC
jgi:hypothetical protein